jgi:hypothetical protein
MLTDEGMDPGWSAALRSAALAVILLRAGLGLDPHALRQLSAVVLRWVKPKHKHFVYF